MNRFILSILLLISISPRILAYAEFEYNGFKYRGDFDDHECKLIKAPEDISGEITIPDVVHYSDSWSFRVVGIGEEAFSGCEQLRRIILPNSITSIAEYAFYGCINLVHVSLPKSCSYLGHRVFGECRNLSVIEFLQSNPPQRLRPSAFYFFDDYTLENAIAIIPDGSTSAYKAESYWYNFKTFYEQSSIKEVQGLKYVIKEDDTCDVAINNDVEGNVIIPEEVTYNGITYSVSGIWASAFEGCNISIVTIPRNVKYIGTAAFRECPISQLNFNAINCEVCGSEDISVFENSIKILAFGDDVAYIPPYMLSAGSQIQNLIIPNKVTKVGQCAIPGFKNPLLKSITIGSAVSEMEIDAIPTYVPKVFWLGNTPPQNYQYYSGLVNYVSNDKYNFIGGESVIYPFLSSKFEVDGIIYVPVSPSERTSDVVDCNYYAIEDEVIIPDIVNYDNILLSVYNISNYAFYDNQRIKTLSLSKLTNEIRKNAFEGCINIESLIFPASISKIDNFAFKGCLSVKEINFEDEDSKSSPVILGHNGYQGLFFDCPIIDLYIGRKLEYPSGEYYGHSPFANSKTLNKVVISDYETKVDDYEFYMCTDLETLQIGNSVKKIGDWAFSGDYSLKYYSAGFQIDSVGKEAFSDCTSITDFYSYSQIPPLCGNQSLDDINKWKCTLYVPYGGGNEYKNSPQWKDFFFIEEMEAVLVAEIELNIQELSLKEGESYSIKANITPLNASNKQLNWVSSDSSIVTVNSEGLVTALSEGEVNITAISMDGSDIKALCKIRVERIDIEPILVESLSISPDEFTGSEGNSFTIVPTILPENADNKELVYSSSNDDVADVNEFGMVTIRKVGSSVITVKTTDGSNLEAQCIVSGTSEIDNLFSNDSIRCDVYDITGMLLQKDADKEYVDGLSKGIYIIVTGNKVIKLNLTRN